MKMEQPLTSPLQQFRIGNAAVKIYASKLAAGQATAIQAAAILKHAISRRRRARLIIGSGNSQEEFIEGLRQSSNIDWEAVELFHMDEYLGMPVSHPASFRHWIKTHLADSVQPGKVHYVQGDAPDPEEECRRYTSLLNEAPIDLSCLGFGENGHIAFNDPHVADFSDPLMVKRIELDERSRLQQIGEGHFPNLNVVPREALTLTCPTLMSARHIVCCVPERRKAEAVRAALEGPLTPACPASLVRTHPSAVIFLDLESASLLTNSREASG